MSEIKEWMRGAEREIVADVRRQCMALGLPVRWRDDPDTWARIIAEHVPLSPPEPKRLTDKDWDTVHELLEPWQKVWSGDRAKFEADYPAWIVDAAAELFAHDMCDAWVWNEYVKAAAVIISRHVPLSPTLAEEKLQAEIDRLNDEIKRRDNCSFIGPMRDCPTHGAGRVSPTKS
jgi:hypothetical protein